MDQTEANELAMDVGEKKCRSCGADVFWFFTEKGKKTPVDCKPVVVMLLDGLTKRAFTPHFATCPNADQHRKKGS